MSETNPYNGAKNEVYYEIKIVKIEIKNCENPSPPVDQYGGIRTVDTMYTQRFKDICVEGVVRAINNYVN